MIEGYLLILLGLFFDAVDILIRPIPIENATRPCKRVEPCRFPNRSEQRTVLQRFGQEASDTFG